MIELSPSAEVRGKIRRYFLVRNLKILFKVCVPVYSPCAARKFSNSSQASQLWAQSNLRLASSHALGSLASLTAHWGSLSAHVVSEIINYTINFHLYCNMIFTVSSVFSEIEFRNFPFSLEKNVEINQSVDWK